MEEGKHPRSLGICRKCKKEIIEYTTSGIYCYNSGLVGKEIVWAGRFSKVDRKAIYKHLPCASPAEIRSHVRSQFKFCGLDDEDRLRYLQAATAKDAAKETAEDAVKEEAEKAAQDVCE